MFTSGCLPGLLAGFNACWASGTPTTNALCRAGCSLRTLDSTGRSCGPAATFLQRSCHADEWLDGWMDDWMGPAPCLDHVDAAVCCFCLCCFCSCGTGFWLSYFLQCHRTWTHVEPPYYCIPTAFSSWFSTAKGGVPWHLDVTDALRKTPILFVSGKRDRTKPFFFAMSGWFFDFYRCRTVTVETTRMAQDWVNRWIWRNLRRDWKDGCADPAHLSSMHCLSKTRANLKYISWNWLVLYTVTSWKLIAPNCFVNNYLWNFQRVWQAGCSVCYCLL